MQTLYALLNDEAKRWWYYRQLREQGNVAEARRKERESIRSTIKTIREAQKYPAAYMSWGAYGMTFHYSRNSRLSGGDPKFYAEICRRFGIPVIDTRSIPVERITETISIPMISDIPDDPPYHGFSYAPLDYVIEKYRELGATIH